MSVRFRFPASGSGPPGFPPTEKGYLTNEVLLDKKEGDRPLMYVRDLEGNEYPVQATSTLDAELNGNVTLSFTILPTKTNNLFIDKITEMWEVVDEEDVTYKTIYCKKQGTGNRLRANIKAIPLFLTNSARSYLVQRHMTAPDVSRLYLPEPVSISF